MGETFSRGRGGRRGLALILSLCERGGGVEINFCLMGRGCDRLRVVPLSLSPSCVTRKKTARKKWSREILEARSTRKEGLPPKLKSLNYALLSQRKNMIGLC